ncbi:hypothetical protein [Nonomuraea endophytica]|uniref:Uncharacterized protein n=1 Tax=Nonomuraea endophytica TaxID=714136 RepID=A0A7W8A7G9_9ACTN|nr:hypothetical protein [Nonomuraea endophytica]MBB5081017.1 hypothetical protein [Nonomuraea endophytica]
MRRKVMRTLAEARPDGLDPVPGGVRAPGRRRGSGWVAMVAVAVVVAAVVTVPRLWMDGRETTATAAGTLDVAAEAARRQVPLPEGNYWSVTTLISAEESAGRYRVTVTSKTERFLPRDPAGFQLLAMTGLHTRPLTAKDAAAWRAAGSPRLCGDDTDCENDVSPVGRHRYTAMPSLWPLDDSGLTLPLSRLVELPVEPAALRERLLALWPAYQERMKDWPPAPKGAALPTRDTWLWSLSLDLLATPVSGGTRAALYQMLEDLPGVRGLGRVTDAGGRPGAAIAMGGEQLVVSEETGQVLARQDAAASGRVVNAVLFQGAKWVGKLPRLPKGCPKVPVRDTDCVG